MPINIFDYWVFILIAIVILFISVNSFYKTIIQPLLPKGKTANMPLPEHMPAKGFEVPIVDAYGGIKDLDRASVTQNFQKPKLILFDDHLVYKLIFRRSARYSDILEVTAEAQFLEHILTFTFKKRALVLTVSIADKKLHCQVMDFFSSKGVMVVE